MNDSQKKILKAIRGEQEFKLDGVTVKYEELADGSYGLVVSNFDEVYTDTNDINFLKPVRTSNLADINLNSKPIQEALIGMVAFTPIAGAVKITEVVQDEKDLEFGRVKLRLLSNSGIETVEKQQNVTLDDNFFPSEEDEI